MAVRPVTFFPPYVQRENVVTNAVLVLLSHTHRLAPDVFGRFLTSLTDESFEVGPTFSNQIAAHGGSSIPDALIRQEPFDVYVETKLSDSLDEGQILAHFQTIMPKDESTQSSGGAGAKFLIGLTRSPIDAEVRDRLMKRGLEAGVSFSSSTFSELADLLESFSAEFRTDFNSFLEEYRTFIQEAGLVPMSENRLLINPCGKSFDQNVRHNVYHDQPERSKSLCKYLGLYKNKSVRRIGQVRAVVTARVVGPDIEVLESHRLPWEEDGGAPRELTADERKRILDIVNDAYYDLRDTDVRYHLVDEFVETNFEKTSKHGIQGHRYFTLDSKEGGAPGAIPHVFEKGEPPVKEIARALSELTWS